MNLFVVLVHAALVIIMAILMTSVLFRRNKVCIDIAYIVMCGLVLLWLSTEIITYVFLDQAPLGFLNNIRSLAVVLLPVVLYVFVIMFYNLERVIPLRFTVGLVLVNTVCALLGFFPFLESLFWVAPPDILALEPLLKVKIEPTSLTFCVLFITQIPLYSVVVVVFSQHRTLPPRYRTLSTLLLWCLAACALAVVVFFAGFRESTGLDASLLGLCGISIILYVAIIGRKRVDYLNVWQGDVFNYLDEAILIVNEQGEIVDTNEKAQTLLTNTMSTARTLTVDAVEEALQKSDTVFVRELKNEDNVTVSTDIYFTEGEYPLVYEVQLSPVLDEAGIKQGEYIILTDVTRNRLSIERLRDLAGYDVLTGLPNRFQYDQILEEWDVAENLPLSIIMGDMNGLKALNDREGHEAGDQLLRTAAAVLQNHCPDEGIVARIGGDEFVMLLRRHGVSEVEHIMNAIREALELDPCVPGGVAIALGSATKDSMDQNMNRLMISADGNMYAEKRRGGTRDE